VIRPTLACLEVPTPSCDGPVNVFVLKGDAIVLIDTGPLTRAGLEMLKRGLARLGAQIKNVDAILLTAPHTDHFGMGALFNDRSNAIVCGHGADRELMEDFPAAHLRRLRAIGTYAQQHGFPDGLYRRVAGMERAALCCGRPLALDVAVRDGQHLEFGNILLRVVHTPGATPGTVCYYEPRLRSLFCGDLVLERPPATAYFNGYAPARKLGPAWYLRSLKHLGAIAARQICPGHSRAAPRVGGLAQRLERRARATQQKIFKVLHQTPQTAYAVANQIAPAARVADRWNSFARTLGVLEQLQQKLKVRTETNANGQLTFALR
jgi:glyoxylase-like metal-dependent hydrolase (beta-lactamase superfamily II)